MNPSNRRSAAEVGPHAQQGGGGRVVADFDVAHRAAALKIPIAGKTTDRESDAALALLREEIITGALAGGSLHSIYGLAERLGVSRTPVRDAVLRLADAGMVAIERNRGVRIRGLSVDDVRKVFEARLLLEVPAAAHAARHGSDELLQELSEIDAQRGKLAQEVGRRLLLAARQHASVAGVTRLDGRLQHGELVDTVLELEADARLFVLGGAALLLAGNTLVLKPSPFTPRSTLLLAAVGAAVGFLVPPPLGLLIGGVVGTYVAESRRLGPGGSGAGELRLPGEEVHWRLRRLDIRWPGHLRPGQI